MLAASLSLFLASLFTWFNSTGIGTMLLLWAALFGGILFLWDASDWIKGVLQGER